VLYPLSYEGLAEAEPHGIPRISCWVSWHSVGGEQYSQPIWAGWLSPSPEMNNLVEVAPRGILDRLQRPVSRIAKGNQ
jgi:hypothetical protein